MSGYIYFVRHAGPDGSIKIGYSKAHPKRRVKDLQVACPFPLELIGFVGGSTGVESEWHDTFSHLKTGGGGEWFSPTPRLLQAINECLRDYVHPWETNARLEFLRAAAESPLVTIERAVAEAPWVSGTNMSAAKHWFVERDTLKAPDRWTRKVTSYAAADMADGDPPSIFLEWLLRSRTGGPGVFRSKDLGSVTSGWHANARSLSLALPCECRALDDMGMEYGSFGDAPGSVQLAAAVDSWREFVDEWALCSAVPP